MRFGYQGTSLSAVGERLGMTPAAIYYHFRSKEDLLFTYLDGAMADLVEETDQALADVSSPVKRLEAFASTYYAFHLRLLDGLAPRSAVIYGISHLMDGLSASNGRKMAKALWAYIDVLRAIIENGVKNGDFATTNVTASAFAVIGIVEHAGLWFTSDPTMSVDDAAALYASHAVRMLAA